MTKQQNTSGDAAAGGPAGPARDDPGRDREADLDPAAAAPTPTSETVVGPPTEPDPNADEPSRADQRQQADAAKYRAQLRTVETERDELAGRVREYQRADIARDLGVDIAEVTGDDEAAMRESAQAYRAKLDAAVSAELTRMGVNPAAPGAEVGSDGRAPATAGSWVDAFKPKQQ